MRKAIEEAEKCKKSKDIPVGAVVVYGDSIIAKGHNQVELLSDPTAHAEMIAITSACGHLGSKFLDDCDLYVTLEPCSMCIGAIRLSRIRKVYYGAKDVNSAKNQTQISKIRNSKIHGGLLGESCKNILDDFFRTLREDNV